MNATQLFAVRGPDDPIRPKGLCQSSTAYQRGREDFVFMRPFNPRAFTTQAEQYTYGCAWEHERREAAEYSAAVRFGARRNH